MKRSSILKKLLIGISVPAIVVLTCSGLLVASKVETTVINQAEQKLEADSVAVSNQVSVFFTQFLSGASQAASNYQVEEFLKQVPGTQRMNTSPGYKKMKITLDKMAAVDTTNILASWVGDFDTSQITQSDGYNSEEGWDITGRPWYRVTQTKGPVLTEPYVDASTGQMIVSAAAPVFEHMTNEIIGAVGYDIKLSQLNQSMSNYKVGEQGFIILCTENGQVIYHPNSDYVQKNVDELNLSDNVKKAFSTNYSGKISYEMDGVEYEGSMNTVEGCGWYVLSGIPHSEMMEVYYSTIRSIVLIFGVGLIVLIGFIFLISAGISRPLKKLALVADKIAGGDLDVTVDVKSTDETGLVANSIERTVLRLRDYINYINEIASVLNQIADNSLVFELKYDYTGEFAKIKDSMLRIQQNLTQTIDRMSQVSNEVAGGAEHVAAGSQTLAQGATEQASSIEELSASISEISERVKNNADSSKQADKMVNAVSTELLDGKAQMEKLSKAMDDINRGSGEIGKVIKTIEDIAFQTNILALNAAVEAARAGSAGKGFAVVAGEVRNLASLSAEAAQSTTKLIEDSVHSVENGTRLADDMARTMIRLADGAQQVSDTINRITEAMERQSESIGQVAIGVEQISGVVQSNSATAEESAAASEQLSGQANALKGLVSQFQLVQME